MGSIWEGLGRLLGASWILLGTSWPLFGCSKTCFFSSVGPILAPKSLSNAFWVDLGRVWEGLGEAKIAILAGIRKDLEHFQQALTDPL